MKQDYGTVTYQGRELEITQQPYICDDGEKYEAMAKDDECIYYVRWPVTHPDAEEAEDMCDWDNYTVSFYATS